MIEKNNNQYEWKPKKIIIELQIELFKFDHFKYKEKSCYNVPFLQDYGYIFLLVSIFC